jgi:GntR family transcriptional regulator
VYSQRRCLPSCRPSLSRATTKAGRWPKRQRDCGQVAAEIRRAIAEGEAPPGERLPPARDLAAVLGVNTNTVLRALRLLRDEGLVDFRRGRGVTVASSSERGAVIVRARELVAFARSQGYRREDLIRIIERLA